MLLCAMNEFANFVPKIVRKTVNFDIIVCNFVGRVKKKKVCSYYEKNYMSSMSKLNLLSTFSSKEVKFIV